jgi:hypothetical protein
MGKRRAQRLLDRSLKMHLRLLSLGGLCCVLVASQALAGPRRCGDDVRGKTVPCDCGDLLVSSRTFGSEDPITQRPCEGTGLLVDVPLGQPAATLTLSGQTLTGTGHGAGIHVLSGGDGGLRIIGPGTVERFGTGILAAGGELARVDGVTAADNRGDGISVGGDAFAVQNSEAAHNGRDGFVLRGSAYRVDGNRALHNARHGFALAGRQGTVGAAIANEASGNGAQGFMVRGRDHVLNDPVAMGNGRDGVRARVARGRITGAYAAGNRRHGVKAAGAALELQDEVAAGDDDRQVRGARSRRCRAGACQ